MLNTLRKKTMEVLYKYIFPTKRNCDSDASLSRVRDDSERYKDHVAAVRHRKKEEEYDSAEIKRRQYQEEKKKREEEKANNHPKVGDELVNKYIKNPDKRVHPVMTSGKVKSRNDPDRGDR